MNKEEAIKIIKNIELIKYSSMEFVEEIISIISQIDEPQKVEIPQFMADWIEECKSKKSFRDSMNKQNVPVDINIWLLHTEVGKLVYPNQELFARAWLDGYEVEKERLYTVEIPDPNANGYSIVLGRKDGKVQIKQTLSTTWEMNCSNQLTESEIRQDFDWAWQWAKPVEVE